MPILNVLDGHHLFVNNCVQVCKYGFDGISKLAWNKVANHESRIISKYLVVDLVDQQKKCYACHTFSKDVEEAERLLGYQKEADFTRILRHWYEAEDKRAMSALERTQKRLELRTWILHDVDLQSFPPLGSHMKGIPQVMFEGYLQSIDTHILLYAQCRNGRAYIQPKKHLRK